MVVAIQVSLCALPTRGKIPAPFTRQAARRSAEYERLSLMLEEHNPSLHQQFVTHAGSVMARTRLKGSDKKALQSFLKAVAADADVHPADKKAIQQFFKRGLSTGAKIGIGVGSAVALAALAAIAAREGISRSMRGALDFVGGLGGTSTVGAMTPVGGGGVAVSSHTPAGSNPHVKAGTLDGAGGSGGLTAGAGAGSGFSGPGGASSVMTEGVAGAGSGGGPGVGPLVGDVGPGGVRSAMTGAFPGAGRGAGASLVPSGRGDGSGEGVGAPIFRPQNSVVYPVEISSEAPLGQTCIFHATGVRAHAGHEINSSSARQFRIDKPNQDCFAISAVDPNKLRLVLADGAGTSSLPNTLYSIQHEDEWLSEMICINSGGNIAHDLVSSLIPGTVSILNVIALFDSSHLRFVDLKAQIAPFTTILDNPRASGSDKIKAAQKLEPYSSNKYFAGMAACLVVDINFIANKMVVVNSGDTGMMVIRNDGFMRHGPSLHPNLEGFANEKGKTGIGYDADRVDSQMVTYDLDGTEDFCVCASDGFWDVFLGPNQLFEPSDVDRYIAEFESGKRPSVNLDKWYSQSDISESRERSKRLAMDATIPAKLQDEYREQSNSKHEPISSRGLTLEAVTRVLKNSENPANDLKKMARTAGSNDDITVVVIDLRPLRSHRAHSAEASTMTAGVAGAGSGGGAPAVAGSGSGGSGDAPTAGER
jgi:serine/threonine protein phosphatase PrpC